MTSGHDPLPSRRIPHADCAGTGRGSAPGRGPRPRLRPPPGPRKVQPRSLAVRSGGTSRTERWRRCSAGSAPSSTSPPCWSGRASGCCSATGCPARTRDVVTDALGLVTLLAAALGRVERHRRPAVGRGRRLGAGPDRARVPAARRASAGPCCGSRPGSRASAAGCSRGCSRSSGSEQRRRFTEGFVAASLLFCVGPLTILGSLVRRPRQRRRPAAAQGRPRRVRGDRVRLVVRLGGRRVGARRARGAGQPDGRGRGRRRAAARAAHRSRSRRPAGCCWWASRCGCCGSGRFRSATCCPRWSVAPLLTAVVDPLPLIGVVGRGGGFGERRATPGCSI